MGLLVGVCNQKHGMIDTLQLLMSKPFPPKAAPTPQIQNPNRNEARSPAAMGKQEHLFVGGCQTTPPSQQKGRYVVWGTLHLVGSKPEPTRLFGGTVGFFVGGNCRSPRPPQFPRKGRRKDVNHMAMGQSRVPPVTIRIPLVLTHSHFANEPTSCSGGACPPLPPPLASRRPQAARSSELPSAALQRKVPRRKV